MKKVKKKGKKKQHEQIELELLTQERNQCMSRVPDSILEDHLIKCKELIAQKEKKKSKSSIKGFAKSVATCVVVRGAIHIVKSAIGE